MLFCRSISGFYFKKKYLLVVLFCLSGYWCEEEKATVQQGQPSDSSRGNTEGCVNLQGSKTVLCTIDYPERQSPWLS